MRVGVVRFPGSNCDDDTLHVVGQVLGETGFFIWHKDTALPTLTPPAPCASALSLTHGTRHARRRHSLIPWWRGVKTTRHIAAQVG